MICDNFLESFGSLYEASISGPFADEVNPVDGVIYPQICKEIPQEVEQEIIDNIEKVLGYPPEISLMFMRRSPEGVKCPHQVHSDATMGGYTMILYINEGDNACTSLVRHKESGIGYNPSNQEFVDIIVKDQNNPDAWHITDMVDMVSNRAFIFKSDMLHRAEPVGGFGQGTEARCVLTCFFS